VADGHDAARAGRARLVRAVLEAGPVNASPSIAPVSPALRVVHVTRNYLSYSQTWIHRQIGWLPAGDVSVVAERLVRPGLSAFPVQAMLVLPQAFPVSYRLRAILSPGGRAGLALAGPFIRSRHPAVMHAHFGTTAWRWADVARRLRVPLVASFYGHDVSALPRQHPRWRRRYRHLFACGSRFLCEGPAMAAALAALGCPRDKIGIQRLGIEMSRVEPVLHRRRADGPLEVLAAARFAEKKGLPDAIAAVALASREIDIRLTIAGGPGRAWRDRAAAARVAEAAAASGLGARLRWVGILPHDELMALARRSHVFIQPSRTAADGDNEGGAPVTLIDVAATGLAAVATRHADIPEVVLDGIGGLLADEGDVEALAANLVRLARQPELLWRLGQGAAAHVRETFAADRCAASLCAHYLAAASEGCG
jgi:colanic acid/amylovoran biosynthesis glycosyltransferase